MNVCFNSFLACGGTYGGREGKIKSPGYPGNNYPGRSNCLYKITVPRGLRVKVKFQNFSVEPAGSNPGKFKISCTCRDEKLSFVATARYRAILRYTYL